MCFNVFKRVLKKYWNPLVCFIVSACLFVNKCPFTLLSLMEISVVDCTKIYQSILIFILSHLKVYFIYGPTRTLHVLSESCDRF
jgi:hypothetical protein